MKSTATLDILLATAKGAPRVGKKTFNEYLQERGYGTNWYMSDKPLKGLDAIGRRRISVSELERLESEYKRTTGVKSVSVSYRILDGENELVSIQKVFIGPKADNESVKYCKQIQKIKEKDYPGNRLSVSVKSCTV